MYAYIIKHNDRKLMLKRVFIIYFLRTYLCHYYCDHPVYVILYTNALGTFKLRY